MMVIIPLPKLYDKSGNYLRSFRPLKVSVEQSIVPLSTASIELPEDESLPARNYVEVFTSMGSAGIFRIRSPQNAYGEDTSVCELEHAIVEVGDYLVREKIAEMMSPKAAMQRIFSHYRGSRWRLGNVDALGTNPIAVQINYENCLTAMISILEQAPSCYMTFDFSTSPWTVMVAAKGSSVSAEGRLSRNVESAKIIYDDSELCTRAYYEVETTDASGEPSSEWKSLDADTINTYGVVEREVPIGAGYTETEALYAAQEYLRKHKKPRVSVEISGQDLSQITGESLDTFTIGKLFRLSLVDYDLTIEDVITGLSWNDVYGNPTEVTVNLADEEDTAVVYIHDIESSGGRSGGGGGGRKRQEDTFKEYYTRFTKTDRLIDLEARHVGENRDILQQAGMYLDANGVLQYAIDNEKNVGARIKTQADRINLVVEGTGENASIKAAEIWLGIDRDLKQSHAKISADIIDIDGVVNKLEAYNIECGDITCGKVSPQSVVSENTVSGAGIIATEYLTVMDQEMWVADAEIVGTNTLRITFIDGTHLDFSKATTLSGAWSGTYGPYRVTASPQGTTHDVKVEFLASGPSGIPIVRPADTGANMLAISLDVGTLSNGKRTVSAKAGDNVAASQELTDYADGRASVTTIRPTSIKVSASQTGTMVGTLSGASSGKYVAFNVGNTQYCILLT